MQIAHNDGRDYADPAQPRLGSVSKLTAWKFVSAGKGAKIALTRLNQGDQSLQQAPQPWRLLWLACSDQSQHGDAGIYLL
jgi:hypothetical protein